MCRSMYSYVVPRPPRPPRPEDALDRMATPSAPSGGVYTPGAGRGNRPSSAVLFKKVPEMVPGYPAPLRIARRGNRAGGGRGGSDPREEHLLGEVPQGAVLWVRELTGVREVRRVRGMVERERGKRLMLALA